MGIALILLCFFLFSCGGDDNGHHSPPPPLVCEYTYSEWGACQADNTQVRTVITQEPEGCVGEPILTQACTYVPPTTEPNDCCPDQASVLRCGDCTPTNPCKTGHELITVYCTGNMYSEPYWYITIDWGIVIVDLEPYDTSCCPVEDTGICYEECNALTKCRALYGSQPGEWYIYGDQYNNWYVYSDRLITRFKVIVNSGN